ncbi:DUF308 domain-containing protein [Dehalobacterium formicoaceticum]|uniref:C4-dicarboxylate ABC transporter n=1 Tax=Dehalobacterium formicoaceticum TaxID=51515 RepID=A0ABT1Y7U0_9FIRM|nr:DUF308 domain-containing protein [Dehalobacterium formicoaceticum]MCR6546944.1 hypothetical protein [Dehalobacterium formicoaceticum]
MTETTVNNNETKISNTAGKWLGWLAIIFGVIAFFWQPIWTGITGIVLGVIGLFSPQRTLNIVGIIVAAIALLVGIV